MNWKLITLGVVTLCLLVSVAYYLNNKSGFVKSGFQNGGNNKNEFIMYYADWCGHCKTAMPEFDKASNKPLVVNGIPVTFAKYESTKDADKLKGVNVKGFPTFILTTANGKTAEYKGTRTADEMLAFINKELGGNDIQNQ